MFLALGVIHHFLYRSTRGAGSGPPVLILVSASMAPVWNEVLEQHGLAWACRVVNLQRLSSDADVRGYQGASLVVIDEAHRLRGGGVWFRRVLTKNRRNVYAPAIADFESYLRRVERGEVDPYPILDRSIVRRSRSDILPEYEERRAAGMVGIERPPAPSAIAPPARQGRGPGLPLGIVGPPGRGRAAQALRVIAACHRSQPASARDRAPPLGAGAVDGLAAAP